MAGRKCNYDNNKLLEVLKFFKTDILNSIGKSTDPLWNRISNHLDNKINPKALYTIVKCNRYDCHEILGINKEENSDNDDSVSNYTCSKYENENVKIIIVDYETWLSMLSPDNSPLKSGWTHIMFECISLKFETNCIWMFNRRYLNLK